MPSRLSLKYPNGRIADVVVEDEVEPGQELNLYGRRWKVVRHLGQVPQGPYPTRRLLCRAVDE
jgi:hypothetical protein